MPIKSLPSNPSLDHLKHQARDLLEALRQGNAEALARTREFHPKFARLGDDEIRAAKLSLAHAQLVIARQYGFGSWPKLKHHVEALAHALSSTIAADFKPPAGAIELKMKWPPGARIVKEMGLKQTMEIFTPGKPEPAKHQLSITTQYAYTVVKELPGGGREVDLQHLSFRLEYDSGSYVWRYDSAWKYAGGQPPIAEPFNLVLRSKVRYFLNANNQIEAMDGVDDLVNRLSIPQGAKLKPGMTWDSQALDKVIRRLVSPVRQPQADISWLRTMFTEEYFRKKLDPSFLPARPVQPGDTWNVSSESLFHKGSLLMGSIGILRDCAVTFRSWEMRGQRLCARLEFQGTEKTRPQTQSETARTMPATAGHFSGVAWFDPELGRGIEGVVTRDFTVTSNKRVASPQANPTVVGPIQATTDHHHQVITEKLVSVDGLGPAIHSA